MSASGLMSLGFAHVYRYQAEKADWFGSGLPREGTEARTCPASLRCREARCCDQPARRAGCRWARSGGGRAFIVIDTDRVALGLVDRDVLTATPRRLSSK